MARQQLGMNDAGKLFVEPRTHNEIAKPFQKLDDTPAWYDRSPQGVTRLSRACEFRFPSPPKEAEGALSQLSS